MQKKQGPVYAEAGVYIIQLGNNNMASSCQNSYSFDLNLLMNLQKTVKIRQWALCVCI